MVNRFQRDFAVLADWMGGAREMIDRWSQLPTSEEVDADQRREHYLQLVVSLANVPSADIKLISRISYWGQPPGGSEDVSPWTFSLKVEPLEKI